MGASFSVMIGGTLRLFTTSLQLRVLTLDSYLLTLN